MKYKKREYGLLRELTKMHIPEPRGGLRNLHFNKPILPSHIPLPPPQIIQFKSIYEVIELTEFGIKEKSKIKSRAGPSKPATQVLLSIMLRGKKQVGLEGRGNG